MLDLKLLWQRRVVRNVSVLVVGTVLAQALTMAAMPLLTRLYSPEEFGALGVFVALLGMISVMANFRYEVAIPLPETDQAAANLMALALACGALTTLAVTLATVFLHQQIAEMTKSPVLARYVWLLPIAVAVTSAYAVLQSWATRKRAFTRVALTRVEQAVGGVSTQLLMGWCSAGALGLIVGQIVANGVGLLGLGRRALAEDRTLLLRGLSLAQMTAVAGEYDRFPKYSTAEAFANMAAVQLPIIIIGSLATSAEVGYLMLGIRLMQVPVGMIGSSVSQVYFSRAVEEHRVHNLAGITARSVASLAKVGVGPLVFAGIVAPAAFSVVFGPEWKRAGELVAWMTPWFVFQFLSSPVSMALHVTLNQPIALGLQVSGFVLRILAVILAGHFLGYTRLSESYAISGLLFYFVYLIVIFRVSKVSLSDVNHIARGALPFVAGWIMIGLAVRTYI